MPLAFFYAWRKMAYDPVKSARLIRKDAVHGIAWKGGRGLGDDAALTHTGLGETNHWVQGELQWVSFHDLKSLIRSEHPWRPKIVRLKSGAIATAFVWPRETPPKGAKQVTDWRP